jgi:hypothetical protein
MTDAPADGRDGGGRYAVRVRGHLGDRWAPWFEGFVLTRTGDGATVLDGVVPDQAALHGVLCRLADLGLPLESVTPVTGEPPTDSSPTRPDQGDPMTTDDPATSGGAP